MPKVVGYHRPSSVEEAVGLLAQPGTAALAGGTRLNASTKGEPVVAVDIQALGLSGISTAADGRLVIGAGTTLQHLADAAELPGTLRDLARREVPSTLRTLATIGGTVVDGDPSGELLAGLLVCDAVVTLVNTGGSTDVALAALLADPAQGRGTLITRISLAVDGTMATDRSVRTPAGQAIVAAVARKGTDGRVRLALSGVARTPVLTDDPSSLSPTGDFKGSTEYRTHVATVLSDRVRKAVAA